MKPEELRIGNYVMYNGIAVKIYGITPPAPNADDYWHDVWTLELFDGAGTITARLEDISAIKLHEDWFNKFEFQHVPKTLGWSSYLKNGLQITLVPTNKGELPAFYFNGKYEYTRTVHSIQNLYYGIFKKEL